MSCPFRRLARLGTAVAAVTLLIAASLAVGTSAATAAPRAPAAPMPTVTPEIPGAPPGSPFTLTASALPADTGVNILLATTAAGANPVTLTSTTTDGDGNLPPAAGPIIVTIPLATTPGNYFIVVQQFDKPNAIYASVPFVVTKAATLVVPTPLTVGAKGATVTVTGANYPVNTNIGLVIMDRTGAVLASVVTKSTDTGTISADVPSDSTVATATTIESRNAAKNYLYTEAGFVFSLALPAAPAVFVFVGGSNYNAATGLWDGATAFDNECEGLALQATGLTTALGQISTPIAKKSQILAGKTVIGFQGNGYQAYNLDVAKFSAVWATLQANSNFYICTHGPAAGSILFGAADGAATFNGFASAALPNGTAAVATDAAYPANAMALPAAPAKVTAYLHSCFSAALAGPKPQQSVATTLAQLGPTVAVSYTGAAFNALLPLASAAPGKSPSLANVAIAQVLLLHASNIADLPVDEQYAAAQQVLVDELGAATAKNIQIQLVYLDTGGAGGVAGGGGDSACASAGGGCSVLGGFCSTQSISFTSTPPADAMEGGNYTVSATASSGLPVSFSADQASDGVCTVSGSTVDFVGVGTCVIDADQAGDASYGPAPEVQQSVEVGEATITCDVTGLIPGPPEQQQVTVLSSAGLASIGSIQVVNGTVEAAPFTPGTTDPVLVTATKTDQTQPTEWSFVATDVLGNTQLCT